MDTAAGFTGGSALARAQLLDAINSNDHVNLTSVSTDDLAFADADAGTVVTDPASGKTIRTDYTVRIDFGDFNQLRGHKEAKAAFSIGLVLLHEVDHKVYKIGDRPNSDTDPGPLENEYLNPIRRELKLAERVHYKAKAVTTGILKGIYKTQDSGNYLTFKIGGKEKILHWQTNLVGGKVE